MKKVLFGMVAIVLAMSAQAALTAQIRTKAPDAPELGSGTIGGYTCYILSGTKMATAMGIKSIGATEVDRVSTWLSANFAVNYQKVLDTKPTSTERMWSNQALDFRNSDTSLSYANRFGIVTWANDDDGIVSFRVFNFNNNQAVQDFATVKGVWADWAAAEPIPEPTSGLLLLLGVAGLALKRKRA